MSCIQLSLINSISSHWEEKGNNNAVVRTYTWGLDISESSQGAGGVAGLLMVNAGSGGIHFTAYDLNGNVMGLVKAADGTISTRYEYGPFGEVFCSVGELAGENPFQFSTKYTDFETDLVYYGYRYYSPDIGRWISRDPIEEQGGFNLYAFVNNDPVNKIDVLSFNTWMPYPAPGRYIDVSNRYKIPTIIDTQEDAFGAWQRKTNIVYPVSVRIISKIKENSVYKEFIETEFVDKVRKKVSCKSNGIYEIEAKSKVFETWNFVIGRIYVELDGSCSWSCDSPILKGNVCGCNCKVNCRGKVKFEDSYDFTVNKDDCFLRRQYTRITGKIHLLLAQDGSEFRTSGRWWEFRDYEFFHEIRR